MKYKLQPTPSRPLAKVIVGNATDARWRDVPAISGMDCTRRHELAKTARKS